MNSSHITRRSFLAAASSGAAVPFLTGVPGITIAQNTARKLALLGGTPVREKKFPSWPIVTEKDEQEVLAALRSGNWSRGELVDNVEKRFAVFMGASFSLITGSGTQALNTSVHALGIGAGDEVLTTPYTFVASVESILLEDALPVFVDVDPDTFQINPDKLGDRLTENTKAIMPVHINGGLAHMDKINAFAKEHHLVVIEDACQVILAEWKEKKAGTLSDLGCFSFQTSKFLTCGEGGAILSEDEKLLDRCYSFHNFGRPRGKYMNREKGGHPILGTKYRIGTITAALLSAQMVRAEEQSGIRYENGKYLYSRLSEIPCIALKKEYPETTRVSFYTFAMRYKKDSMNGVPREKFMKALAAEGIPCSWGLGVLEGYPMHREGLIEDTLASKTFRKIYSKERLTKYREENLCPEADKLAEEVMGFSGNLLLGTRQDMDDIVNAFTKVYENRGELA